MNVYVRELVGALAQAGVDCTTYVRAWSDDLPDTVEVESGFRVVHVPAGPAELPKEHLGKVVDEFTSGVRAHIQSTGGVDAVHANYWLSGVVGHHLKHELDVPLVCTFHTLARVKADTGDAEPERRLRAEAEVITCCDAILANSPAEVAQLTSLYGAVPSRVELVPPGVDHAFFSPGPRPGARAALGLDDRPVLLFAGRVQPLKGLDVAIRALAELRRRDAVLVVVGGPSGAEGEAYEAACHQLVEDLGLAGRVVFRPPQPHHLLSSYYRAADVCIVPSRSESFGLVALESAACGTPVVCAAVGGLLTLVEDGRTGLLVEGRQPADYAAAVDRLLADERLAARMGRDASAKARGYTWSTTAARLRRIYGDVAARGLVECTAS
ncbi:MAG: glycosyltransferase [Acidimicrobiia bacterium]|nr:glycosyltransferase [Acidimicrobiia bacterium]